MWEGKRKALAVIQLFYTKDYLNPNNSKMTRGTSREKEHNPTFDG